MKKYTEKGYNTIKKIGKRNFIIFFLIIIAFVIVRIYNTFSLNTEISQSYIDGIKTYEFIINSSKNNNSVTISEKSSKNITIKISNPDNTKLKYGLYYSSNDYLTDTYLGYKKESKKTAKGLIDGNDNYLIDLKIVNLSNQSVTIDFGISYGLEHGGELKLPADKTWVDKYSGPFSLTDAKLGSYVYYEGNNGCSTATCNGTNINTSNENKGYCYKEDAIFKTDGWRLAYTKNDTPYIISSGALDCISSDNKGIVDNKILNSYEKELGLPTHTSTLNKKALSYCNRKYAYNNSCDSHSSWAMDVIDFKYITNQVLSSDKCFKQSSKKECGYDNNIIDIGSYYWIANSNNGIANTMFYWDPKEKYINSTYTNYPLGIRPVLRLNDNIYIIKGTGTEKDPYLLDTFSDESTYDITEKEEQETKNVKYLSDYIKEEYDNGKEINTINLNNDNSIKVNLNKNSNIMLDNNNIYRYYGNNPNNYVMFNDELWRIVTLSNTKTNKNDTSGRLRAKIVRANSLGNYSYNSNKEEDKELNDWSSSDLMQELNELYYNQKSGKCTTGDKSEQVDCDFTISGLDNNARYLIDDALYYLAENKPAINELYAHEYYTKERTEKTWSGKVGLIYGSDYMYAADLNVCKEKSKDYKDNNNCNNNWLYQIHNNVLSNLEEETASKPREIYPVVYLKNNIIISEGTGTKENPFILEIDS